MVSAAARSRPLEALSRGLLGPAVAELVNSLRLNADLLRGTGSAVAAVEKGLGAELAREVRGLRAAQAQAQAQAQAKADGEGGGAGLRLDLTRARAGAGGNGRRK